MLPQAMELIEYIRHPPWCRQTLYWLVWNVVVRTPKNRKAKTCVFPATNAILETQNESLPKGKFTRYRKYKTKKVGQKTETEITIKWLGSAEKVRVGRVTGNKHIFYFGLINTFSSKESQKSIIKLMFIYMYFIIFHFKRGICIVIGVPISFQGRQGSPWQTQRATGSCTI